MDGNFFEWDRNFNEQPERFAIGSPILPVFSEAVEHEIVPNYSHIFWTRYMDDISLQ